jgi:hypothetical protein
MPVYLAVNLWPRIPFKNSYRRYEEKLISSLNCRKNREQGIDSQQMILVEVFPQDSTFLLDKIRLFCDGGRMDFCVGFDPEYGRNRRAWALSCGMRGARAVFAF